MLKYPHSNPYCENDDNYWFSYLLFDNPREQLTSEIEFDSTDEFGDICIIPFNHPLSETVHKNMDKISPIYPVDWNNLVNPNPIVLPRQIGEILIAGMVDKIEEAKNKMHNPGNGEIPPVQEFDSDGEEMNVLDKWSRNIIAFFNSPKIKNQK